MRKVDAMTLSYTLDDLGTLAVQLIGVAGVRLLLAVLQTGTSMSFQHAVFGAEVTIAEATVADDALSGLLALLEGASRLARRHYECGGETLEGGRGGCWDAEAIRGLEREVRIVDKEAKREFKREREVDRREEGVEEVSQEKNQECMSVSCLEGSGERIRRNGCGEIGSPPNSIYIVPYIAEDIVNLGSNR